MMVVDNCIIFYPYFVVMMNINLLSTRFKVMVYNYKHKVLVWIKLKLNLSLK